MVREGCKETEPGEIPEDWVVECSNNLFRLEYGSGLSDSERSGKGFPVHGSNEILYQ